MSRSRLSGHYDWPIQVLYGFTMSLFITLFFYALKTGGHIGWLIYASLGTGIFGVMLFLYSQTIPVDINELGVFIRKKRIEVSPRIRKISYLNDRTLKIDFNLLYHLQVQGDPPEIQRAWNVLVRRFACDDCRNSSIH